jgi:hypothetical protein
MRRLVVVVLLSVFAAAQGTNPPFNPPAPEASADAAKVEQVTVAAGTKVPVTLKQAISTKSARAGDPVYAETTFPVVANDRVLIPAGTYVQGRIDRVQRAGRIKGRAEILMHFTTLIYPNGYTVMLPGSIENVPGTESTSMKDKEGTIRQDGQKGKDAGEVATTAGKAGGAGALIGGLSSGSRGGALVGAGAGAAIGAAVALLARGSDVRLDSGTTVEMVIQRPIPLDPARITVRARDEAVSISR